MTIRQTCILLEQHAMILSSETRNRESSRGKKKKTKEAIGTTKEK